jgi:ribokinase
VDIVVVGSINLDTVLNVDHLPREGETVTAVEHFTNPGGKGANQAVAAARLGRSVAFVGCVGDDAAGRMLVDSLEENGVDTSSTSIVDSPSGMAAITVGPKGANTIVVSPGANARLSPERVESAAALIRGAGAVMVQLEIPLESVAMALRLADGITVLNPAPARRLDSAILRTADVIVPNETELAILLGDPSPGQGVDYAKMAAAALADRVVVTLGAAGAVYVDRGSSGHVPAPPVEAIDTTGAGDAFCAGLTDALLSGSSMGDAVAWGVRAGSITVTRPGAQIALPTRDELLA